MYFTLIKGAKQNSQPRFNQTLFQLTFLIDTLLPDSTNSTISENGLRLELVWKLQVWCYKVSSSVVPNAWCTNTVVCCKVTAVDNSKP